LADPAGAPGRFEVLGVEIDDLDSVRAIKRFEDMIASGRSHYVVFCTASTLVTAGDDDELRTALGEADLVTPDGMPLVWLGRRRGLSTQRVYGPDFMLDFLARTGARYRHFFYGGGPGVADRLVARLTERFPELRVAGAATPPFGAEIQEAGAWDLETIAAASPDVVWVGLGHPKQEKWMRLHHERIGAPVLAGVGAAFDFLSGEKKEAPAWMKRVGLQWVHRLFSEPRRLWRRYLIGNSVFVARLVKEHRSRKRKRHAQ